MTFFSNFFLKMAKNPSKSVKSPKKKKRREKHSHAKEFINELHVVLKRSEELQSRLDLYTRRNQPSQPYIVQLQDELWTRKMKILSEAARARVSKKIDDSSGSPR